MWIGFAMLFVGFWALIAIVGWDASLAAMATVPYRNIHHYPITTIPLFVLMGFIVSNTGVGKDMYYTAHKWMGQMKGGLASATVAACAGLAAITGTSMAALATMGRVALPEMKRYSYDEGLAVGCIAAGSTIGILIPPSMGFILYGILTETSIGALFMAGLIPGILEAVFYIITIYIICSVSPKMGPPGPKTSMKDKIFSLRKSWAVLLLFILVIGGIYMGIFTPTEAGAIGAFGAILITLVSRQLNRENLLKSILETAQITAMMIVIIVGAFIFQNMMAVSKLPFVLGEYVAGLAASRMVIMIAIIAMYIVLGMFLDVMSCIILTIPIIYPVILAMDFNPIWYGVIMVRIMEIGAITPPVGMQAFMLSGITGVPIGTIFRGIVPFVIADILHVALLVAVPAISLFLPNTM
jgi:tripartite ATP-independent transporter DctM subunit